MDQGQAGMMDGSVAVVLKGYPRLSETFIAQELLALERRGVRLRIYALRRPHDRASHPVNREIVAPVTWLPAYLHRAPGRIVQRWLAARRRPGFAAARDLFVRDWRRDRTRNRLRRFGQACVLASALPADCRLLYAHFLHTPASVARYSAAMTGLPLVLSGHAKDIWTSPAWDLRQKLAAAAWTTTCTGSGLAHLRTLAPAADIRLVRHGLDFSRFPPPPDRSGPDRTGLDRTGRDPARPVRLVSVGRLVAKKGYGDLLTALAGLPGHLHWRFVHVGGGALAAALRRQAEALGLTARIEWRGPQPQAEVLAALRQADLFVLASRIAADGDRDGLPNVLLEAQSQGVACLASHVSAIPELIVSGETGLLVPAGDPPALTAALTRLASDPAWRLRLARAGQQRVRAEFGMAAGADRLAAWLRGTAATQHQVTDSPAAPPTDPRVMHRQVTPPRVA